MPEYYRKTYPLIKKHFKKKEDYFYVYFRGVCFKNDTLIIDKWDTVIFEQREWDQGYFSVSKNYPFYKKKIKIRHKNRLYKIKADPKYFFIEVCYSRDTLRTHYYDYPSVDVIQ